jgi:hypothetical protein
MAKKAKSRNLNHIKKISLIKKIQKNDEEHGADEPKRTEQH